MLSNNNGVASLTFAAHEAGHWMGHKDEYNAAEIPDKSRELNVMAAEVDDKNIITILSAFGGKNTVKTYRHATPLRRS